MTIYLQEFAVEVDFLCAGLLETFPQRANQSVFVARPRETEARRQEIITASRG